MNKIEIKGIENVKRNIKPKFLKISKNTKKGKKK
jgi:hypothetical protein